jgi:hypothetical protein
MMKNDADIKHSNDDSEDYRMISHVTEIAAPKVTAYIREQYRAEGLVSQEEGQGPDTTITVTRNGNTSVYILWNTLIEIASIDIDDVPLRFDEGLWDYYYFVKKMKEVVEIRIRVILGSLNAKNSDDLREHLKKCYETGDYERICRWRTSAPDSPQS